jgi:hypothetical protein
VKPGVLLFSIPVWSGWAKQLVSEININPIYYLLTKTFMGAFYVT